MEIIRKELEPSMDTPLESESSQELAVVLIPGWVSVLKMGVILQQQLDAAIESGSFEGIRAAANAPTYQNELFLSEWMKLSLGYCLRKPPKRVLKPHWSSILYPE